MTLWIRLIATLMLAPLAYWLALAYVGSRQGDDMSQAAPFLGALQKIVLVYTLPALLLIAAVLGPADFVLRKLGLGLLVCVVSPLLAWGVAALAAAFSKEPHVQAFTDATGLFVTYGLVWGLSIREPRLVSRSTSTVPA